MKATTLAKWEKGLREFLTRLPPETVIEKYSHGRKEFLTKLNQEKVLEAYIPPKELEKKLWGLSFQTNLFNAAGMFKNGECSEMVFRQGAGAYLGGTGTWNSRTGNEKNKVHLPFTPYPRSHAASNWLGLPNKGDIENAFTAKKIVDTQKEINNYSNFPIGWSIMGSPDYTGEEKLQKLVESMNLYKNAGVHFLEINESCPNTTHGKPQNSDLEKRLHYIKKHFLNKRDRNIPVIVKFSNDTTVEQVPYLLDLLFSCDFDGVNFGNTSTQYEKRKKDIHQKEHKLFDYFTQTFGGGLSGKVLKEDSLLLASTAASYVKAGPPSQEFHVIRTGGIDSLKDIEESNKAGISLNQWFTGYFEHFAENGHDVYRELFKYQKEKISDV